MENVTPTMLNYFSPNLTVKSISLPRYTGRNRLRLHSAIYCPDSFVLMLRYCANLKAVRSTSTNLYRIVADKLHRVIVAIDDYAKDGRSRVV